MAGSSMEHWDFTQSEELYGIRNWGEGFFRTTEAGEVAVDLNGPDGVVPVSLHDVALELSDRGIPMPVLLRFPDILAKRLETLNTAFRSQMTELGYKGEYRGVFPIKVNQQQQVIEEVVTHGAAWHHGLEAGSKPELIIALTYLKDPDSLIICNGYKDQEFIDLALMGVKAGMKVFLVVERPGEITTIIRRARELGVKPRIGIRAKLSSTVGGKWASSAGDHSVFGLNPSQIIAAVDNLAEEGMLDSLELLHYHLGSQIPDIRSIRTAAGEAARVYASLVKEGAVMGFLDTGGGLAVDYDGSQTNFYASMNYSLSEYCSDLIDVVMSVMDEEGIHHPTLISESGRAVSAHSSVLLFNILDTNRLVAQEDLDDEDASPGANLKNLYEVLGSVTVKNIQESYHDALYYRDEIRTLFRTGGVDLRERGLADQTFWKIMARIAKLIPDLRVVPEELQNLDRLLADVYYGNFSLFQSLPDSWAIDQLFPILPVHRLNEKPENTAIISDTTCDSDGKIDRFIDIADVRRALPLHEPIPGEDYIIGVFMIGAYQETLGDLHNLFGDTYALSVSLDDEGIVHFKDEIVGDSVADVLSYVEYEPKEMRELFRDKIEAAVRKNVLTPLDRRRILEAYEEGLRGYTYFES